MLAADSRRFVPTGVLVVAIGLATSAAAQQQRVYLAPDDHTDYWWSGTEAQYQQAFVDTLNYYLDQADATAANPSEYQSRWNCDGSFWLWTYERNQPAADFERLIERIRDGHVSVPLNALCVCLGGTPAEAVLRGMYYPGRIERRHELRFRLAYLIENQTHPCGIHSLWAGSGALYSWKGICGCATFTSAADREHEIYRALGPDGQGVLMKWNSMLVGNQGIGGYAEARYPSAIVDFLTTNAPFNGFAALYPYDVIGAFGKGWDDFQTQTDEFVTVAQTMTDATRQVVVSNEVDFFQDFAGTYDPAALPAEQRSYGNEWELHAASLAEVSARVKRSIEKLRAAEALAAIISLHDAAFLDGRAAARDLAFMNYGLFWEHDFGMDGFSPGHPWYDGRLAWQRRLADEIDAYVDDLHADGRTALGDRIAAGGVEPRFFAFNPLGWERDDFADLPWSDTAALHVVDVQSGSEVPAQIVTVDGVRTLRIWAENIPAVGYRVFEIRGGAGAGFDAAATVSGSSTSRTIENTALRIIVSGRGAISSWVDKLHGDLELVQTIGGRQLNDLGSGSGTVTVEELGPVCATVKAVGATPLAHTSLITVYRDSGRIDVRDEITQNFEATTYWGFGLNLAPHLTRHEEVGAILRAKLTTSGGDYSPRNARYDWLTLNRFADMSGPAGVGVTLSNWDCYYFQLGNSSTTTLDTLTPQIKVLAGGRVANGFGGFRNQGGDAHFLQRFALRAHGGYDAAAALRFALEHQNPLVCGLVAGGAATLPADVFSAVSVADPDVLLTALKPAEEGISAGLIARLWNLGDAPQSTTVQLLAAPLQSAVHTSHIETDEAPLTVSAGGVALEFLPQQMRTMRLLIGAAPCPGDLNHDGMIDLLDLSTLLANFGLTSGASADDGDLDGDGDVDLLDLSALLVTFGTSCA